MLRPRYWNSSSRTDVITFYKSIHTDVINTLDIGSTASPHSAKLAKQIVSNIWDVFAPEGIRKTIFGYKFKIDTGTSAWVCCRPPSYDPNESKVIEEQLKVLLHNGWVRKCEGGSYGAPIVLAPKPH